MTTPLSAARLQEIQQHVDHWNGYRFEGWAGTIMQDLRDLLADVTARRQEEKDEEDDLSRGRSEVLRSIDTISAQSATSDAPKEDAERTIESLAKMLGWENVPPRHVLESDIATLMSTVFTRERYRLEDAASHLDETNALRAQCVALTRQQDALIAKWRATSQREQEAARAGYDNQYMWAGLSDMKAKAYQQCADELAALRVPLSRPQDQEKEQDVLTRGDRL